MGDQGAPAKPSKDTPIAPSYPDWTSSMQGYYGSGATPPFYSNTVAPPTPHPYMWGTRHALIPPYGTPIPYPAMYPPAGIYAHPNMAQAPNMGQTNTEIEGKTQNEEDPAPRRKQKVRPGGKGRQSGKAASESGNDVAIQSSHTGRDGSSDASDNDDNQGYANATGGFEQKLVDGANTRSNLQTSVPGNPVVSLPGSNLNIGMNLWNATSTSDGTGNTRPNLRGHSASPMIGGEGVITNQWANNDERELKREKRKQSNRESARRSRLRKQAECEELQAKVEKLTNENQVLRDELQRLSQGCQKLASENNSIKDELNNLSGNDTFSSSR